MSEFLAGNRRLAITWSPWQVALVFLLTWSGVSVLLLSVLVHIWPPLREFFQAKIIFTQFLISLINTSFGIALIAWVVRRRGSTLADLGLRPFNIRRAAFYIVGGLVAFVLLAWLVIGLLSVFVPGFNASQPQVNEFAGAATPLARALSFLALVVLPPLFEETLFRGFMFASFASRWGTVAGMLLSSLIFGLAHLQGNVGVYTFVLGLLLCVMYKRTGSIVPGMLLHMLNNYLAYMATMGKL